MSTFNVDYQSILSHISNHLAPGRSESAAFLIWYLENYYRLDSMESVDAVCDQKGDKGVDGIYLNQANGTIDIFQAKLYQNPNKAIGDSSIKEFAGTLSQFSSKSSVNKLIQASKNTQLLSLMHRLDLINIYDQYKIRGVFVSNANLDNNGMSVMQHFEHIEFVGKNELGNNFISNKKSIPEIEATFDIAGLNVSKHFVDSNTLAFIAPIKASELVAMPGISDQSVFAYNVRGPLGGTSVNKDIVKSIKDQTLHKMFPLFHNGITILANHIEDKDEKLTIKTFYVVNGCQSLTALFNNRNSITNELNILTKFIQVGVDSELSKIITHYSNNQNGVKARDFKSNNTIQIRLQNEFKKIYKQEYFYEIKRGELGSDSIEVISNEQAGILLLAFDLKEPWSTHRKYQVFDEKYNQVFARPEVTADRIVLLNVLHSVIGSKLGDLSNRLVAKYILTRYAILYMLRLILERDETGLKLLEEPGIFVRNPLNRKLLISIVNIIVGDIVIDLNSEFGELGEDFDYRSKFRDENWVKSVSKEILNGYLKQVQRNRIETLGAMWRKGEIVHE